MTLAINILLWLVVAALACVAAMRGQVLLKDGARATAELLAEVGHCIGGMPCILGLLNEYQRRLNPCLLHAVGGDRFPRRALRVVPQ